MNATGKPSTMTPEIAGSSEDGAWAQRLAARDPAALREVIAFHAGRLHRIAWRMTRDAQESEDIVQEAMLRLWDQAPRIAARHSSSNEGAGFRIGAWLQRVVTNLAIDRLRRTKRLIQGELPEREDDAPLADAMVEAREDGSLARALIAALPDRQRAAIVLTYYEELPNAQAAAAMDMNIKAFESLLHRARTGLRQAFVEQGGAA